MGPRKNNVESIEFTLGKVNYALGLRVGGKDGIRATWNCQHCAMMGVTDKPKPTHAEALELAKEEVLQHHNAFHRGLVPPHNKPVSSPR